MDKSEYRNAELLDGEKHERAVREYGHAQAWINEVAEEGRDGPAFTTPGWWRPGSGGSRDARCLVPWITFDIDEAGDIPGAYDAARGVIADLYRAGFGLEQMYASFSGRKGFHITVSAGYLGMPYYEGSAHAHGTLKDFFSGLIEKHAIDPKPLSPLLPIRLTNSCHADTGNRKWTLPAKLFAKRTDAVGEMIHRFGNGGDEDLTMDAIHAPGAFVTEFPHPFEAPTDSTLAGRFAETWEEVRSAASSPSGNRNGAGGYSPNGAAVMPDVTYRAFQGVGESERFGVGHAGRDEAAFLLACHWLLTGKSAERVLDLLEKWDRQRNDPPLQDDPDEPSGVLRHKVNSASQHLHSDGDLDEPVRL